MMRAAGMLPILALAVLLVTGPVASCAAEPESDRTSVTTGPVVGPGSASEIADETVSETGRDVSRDLSGDVPTVRLPTPRAVGPMSLEEAVQSRRSVREYSDEPLTLEEVGQLLWAAQGITSVQGARAAPSAGGTYPLEIYLAAGNVHGLEPGVYRYRPTGHDLVLVTAGDIRPRLTEACLDQAWVGRAAVDIVIAAVYERTTARYGDRGVRYVHLEAGHAAQNLCLQAVALGLGVVTVGAFIDEDVRAVIPLADEETPLYVIPVGHRS